MTESKNYESNLSLWDKIRIVQEWAPVATYIQAFLTAKSVNDKAIIVSDAAEWLSAKTQTKFDDELVSHVSAILRSKEGEEFLTWVVAKIEEEKK
jgi:hypothetical protein